MADLNPKKAILVLSGGQDSTTSGFWAKREFEEIYAITFDYGQRHSREIDAAKKVAVLLEVSNHEILTVGPILDGRSPLTDHDTPLEQYADFSSMDKIIGDRIEKTFVPMRNALFLTIAANRASCIDSKDIVTGVCQADNANYPDCRLDFVIAMEGMIDEALGYDSFTEGMKIHTPLMDMSKAESISFAIDIGAYPALGYSHTAYDGSYPPVGKDHATVLRAHGFEEAGVPDPLIMRAFKEGLLSELPSTTNYETKGLKRFEELVRQVGYLELLE